MPDQAIHDMRQALVSAAPTGWEALLSVDLEAALIFTEADYDHLSVTAQERALAGGHDRGDPVMIGFTLQRGEPPTFTLFGRDRIPNLQLLRATRTPRIAPEAAERMRALRHAMPSMTEGEASWAKAEFQAIENPLQTWFLGADEAPHEEGVFGRQSTAMRRGGVALLDDRLIYDFAGDGAAAFLAATLEGGSAGLAYSHDFDVYYLRGRAAPEPLIRALLERWGAQAEPAADIVITAEPIEPAPEPDQPAEPANGGAEPCWYCGGESAPDAASKVLLYDPASVERSVEAVGASDQYRASYQQLSVPVPRCLRCESAHFRDMGWKVFGLVAGGLTGAAAAYWGYGIIADWGGWLAAVGWAGLVLVLIVLAGIGLRLGQARGKASRGPIGPEDRNLEFPLVSQLLAQGYQLGKPEARAPQ